MEKKDRCPKVNSHLSSWGTAKSQTKKKTRERETIETQYYIQRSFSYLNNITYIHSKTNKSEHHGRELDRFIIG